MKHTYQKQSIIKTSAQEVFDWHCREGSFERLVPPWKKVSIVERAPGLKLHSQVTLKIKEFIFPIKWVVEHTEVLPGEGFTDTQLHGPFSSWRHRHLFEPLGNTETRIKDDISYELRGGAVGDFFASSAIARDLEHSFRYRHTILKNDLACVHYWKSMPSLKISFVGTGVVADQMIAFLLAAGHRILPPLERNLQHCDALIALNSPEKDLLHSLISLRLNLPARLIYITHLKDEKCMKEWDTLSRGRRAVLLRLGTIITPLAAPVVNSFGAHRFHFKSPWWPTNEKLPWISLDDAIYRMYDVLQDTSVEGMLNIYHPELISFSAWDDIFQKILPRKIRLTLPSSLCKKIWEHSPRFSRVPSHPHQEAKSVSWTFPTLLEVFKHQMGR